MPSNLGVTSLKDHQGLPSKSATFLISWLFAWVLLTGVPVHAQDTGGGEAPEIPSGGAENPALTEYFPDSSALQNWIASLRSKRRPGDPAPPRLPEKFRWTGRYVVSDLVDHRTGKLGIEVPFVWFAQDGNMQMIAGKPGDPIFFTNFIYKDHLYTATFAWPKLEWWKRSPFVPTPPLFKLSQEDLNTFLASSRYAGPEILQHKRSRHVHHFRATVVVPPLPSGSHLRFPILIADFYVDQKDSTKFWQVLHFGYQNLFDPELDEWIFIDKMENGGGELILPPWTIEPKPAQ